MVTEHLVPRRALVGILACLASLAPLARAAPQAGGSAGGLGADGALALPHARHLLIVLVDDCPPLECFSELAGFEEQNGDGVTSRSALYPETPVIDALAADGLRFFSFRTSPLCSPTRASLLTGRYPFRHGVGGVVASEHDGPIGEGGLAEFGDAEFAAPSIVQALDAAGVRTAVVGKLHLSTWTTQEFSRNPGVYGTGWEIVERFAAPTTFLATQLRNLAQLPVPGGGPAIDGGYYNYFGNGGADNAEIVAITQYATSWQVDRALEFYAGLRPSDRSFCLLALNAAHGPFGKSEHVLEQKRDFPPAELVATQEYSDCVDQAIQEGFFTAWPQYLASVEALDAELGRLLAGLAPSVRSRLTVLLLGDNGVEGAIADGRIRWGKDFGPDWNWILDEHRSTRLKGSVYQWGSTACALWSGRGLDGQALPTAGTSTWAMADVVDIAVTSAEFFGVEPFASDGVSLLPLVHEGLAPDQHARQHTLAERFLPCGDWQRIASGDAPDEQLGRGFQRWLDGASFPNGVGGRFSLVRAFAGGAWHDELYLQLAEDGTPVDLFERTDLLPAGGYEEQHAAMLADLEALLVSPL